jgi:AcrR family transcriptional regulator
MPRPKTIADDELLRIAREVFGAHGHAASTRDVAAAAGISEAVLYKRFRTKDALFRRAMQGAPPDLETLLGPYSSRNPKADLLRIARHLEEFFAEHMATVLAVVTNPELHGRHMHAMAQHLPFADIERGVAERVRRLRDDGLVAATIKPAAAARAIVRVAHGAAFLAAVTGDQGEHDLRDVIDVLWAGLSAD